MSSPELRRIISRADDLPTLPRTVLKITELVNDPKSSAKDLARVITEDQVLTARLLKLVNSSFYGFPQRISTVTGAVVLLGFDAIRNLLLTTSVFDLFAGKSRRQIQRQEAFWDHSLGCALGAKVIGEHLRHDKVEELFVAGLLHDIGKIVAMLLMPEKFEQVSARVEESDGLMIAAEESVMKVNHADIGRLLAERWNLPKKLIKVIDCHHRPEEAGNFMLETAVVHVADIFARALNLGSGGDRKMPPLSRTAWNYLSLQPPAIEPIMASTLSEFDDIRKFLN
jgi:putative nucleotidyltransferase with HDIG domain